MYELALRTRRPAGSRHTGSAVNKRDFALLCALAVGTLVLAITFIYLLQRSLY